MRKYLLSTLLCFVSGLALVFWVMNLNLVGGEYSARVFDMFMDFLRFFNSTEAKSESYYLPTTPYDITEFDLQKSLFLIAFGFGVLTILLSVITRVKFGYHYFFPASTIAGVCLCFIAIERGLYIGIL